jgi:hypothetical protein
MAVGVGVNNDTYDTGVAGFAAVVDIVVRDGGGGRVTANKGELGTVLCESCGGAVEVVDERDDAGVAGGVEDGVEILFLGLAAFT